MDKVGYRELPCVHIERQYSDDPEDHRISAAAILELYRSLFGDDSHPQKLTAT